MIASDEFDALTGLRTRIGFEEGKMHVNYSQDITAAMDRNRKLRDAPEYSKTGIKRDMWHVAHIPDSVCLKIMTEDGLNPYTCGARELMAHLKKNRDKYGYLFTTSGQV